ncbi:MAG: porin [Burkholderiaceae bacterium]
MKARSLCVSALALSAVAGGAQAQTSSVTMYGLIDLSVGVQTNSDAYGKHNQYLLSTDNGASSRIGFRGREDLGGGLAATFKLEATVTADRGGPLGAASSGTTVAAANAFFRRGATVGLSGGFGDITLGRDYTAGILNQAATLVALTTGINEGFAGAVLGQGIGSDFWNNNQIRYVTPRMAGLQFTGAMSAGETNVGNRAGSTFGFDLNYDQGPLRLDATYQKDYGATGADVGKSIYWYMLSGAYKFGGFRVTAGYDRVSNPKNAVTGGGFKDSKLMTVGLAYSLTPLMTLAGQYYQVKDLVTDKNTKQYLLEVKYSLSKRTSVYTKFNHVSAGTIPVSPIYLAPSLTNGSANALMAGVQHSF